MIEGLASVIIWTDNFQEMARFYEEILSCPSTHVFRHAEQLNKHLRQLGGHVPRPGWEHSATF